MINALLILLCCQLAGEAIVYFTGITIPGSVVGMALLLIGLVIKGGVPDNLDQTAGKFIQYIGLLFVPAGAGIVLYLDLIVEQWIMILVASFTATVLTLILSAYVFQLFSKNEKDNN